MNDFKRRLISSIRVTEEGTRKTNLWGKKRKREIASAEKAINKVDQKKMQNFNIASKILTNSLSSCSVLGPSHSPN